MAVFTGNGSAASPSFTFSSDTNTGIFRAGPDALSIAGGGVTRLHISGAGNVGIGTATPSTQLHINNGPLANNQFTITSGDGTNFGRFTAQVGFGVGSTGSGDFSINALDSLNGLNVGPNLIFSTQGSFFGATFQERGRFSRDGYFRLSTASGGIQFGGDTAAANALNDYEEGTWTPNLFGPASQTISAQTGYYVKIGSTVYLSGRISWSVAPTGGSNYRVVLPFGSATNRPESMNAMPVHKNTNNSNIVYLGVFANTADAFFYNRNGSAANFAGEISTGELTFAGVYAVN
jgi:hypothetical protein